MEHDTNEGMTGRDGTATGMKWHQQCRRLTVWTRSVQKKPQNTAAASRRPSYAKHRIQEHILGFQGISGGRPSLQACPAIKNMEGNFRHDNTLQYLL
jgi:hypothetical protein